MFNFRYRSHRLFNLTGAVAIAALAGCSDSTAPAPPLDQIVARWAGDVWTGNTSVNINHYGPAGDSIFFLANRTGVAQLEETILVRTRFAGVGTYTLGPGAVRLVDLVGGDVITGEYDTTPDATGTIVITKFDAGAEQIEGTLSFVGVSATQAGRYGTRANFEDGRFRATLLNPAVP